MSGFHVLRGPLSGDSMPCKIILRLLPALQADKPTRLTCQPFPFPFSYGTFDHLLLLMGRLSEFVSDDLPRKRMANKVPGPPGAPSPPMFPGMFPSRGKVSAPSGFSSSRDASPQSDGFEDGDIHAATEAALAKWESLRQAFEVFRGRLGPEFQPLADEYSDRRDSPFGPAIQYRTFSVAGIWMNFNMGLICLYRAHPSMPPAAMMAAGRAARDTAPMAREIGRIAAGLSDDTLSITEISTLVGAAFIESSFCLFVAGIQVRDPPLAFFFSFLFFFLLLLFFLYPLLYFIKVVCGRA